MTEGIGVVGLYVHDQDEALAFYVGKLGFQIHTDARNGNYRWLAVKHPNQPSFELGLFLPQEPVLDAATTHIMRPGNRRHPDYLHREPKKLLNVSDLLPA